MGFIILFVCILVSNVNAAIYIQPIDVQILPPNESVTSPRVSSKDVSQLGNIKNNRKSDKSTEVIKHTREDEKVPVWVGLLSLVKKNLIDKDSKQTPLVKKPTIMAPINKPITTTSTEAIEIKEVSSPHAEHSKKPEDIINVNKNAESSFPSASEPKETPKKIDNVETSNKRVEFSLPPDSPSKHNSNDLDNKFTSNKNKYVYFTHSGESNKGEDVITVNNNVVPPLFYNSPSNKNSSEVGEEETASKNTESSSFTREPKETPKKMDNVETSNKSDEFSIPSDSPSNNSIKVSDVGKINNNVLITEQSQNSEKEDNVIATSNVGCDSSSSLCTNSSQECRHGNVCTSVLILASSLYFYHTVGAFE